LRRLENAPTKQSAFGRTSSRPSRNVIRGHAIDVRIHPPSLRHTCIDASFLRIRPPCLSSFCTGPPATRCTSGLPDAANGLPDQTVARSEGPRTDSLAARCLGRAVPEPDVRHPQGTTSFGRCPVQPAGVALPDPSIRTEYTRMHVFGRAVGSRRKRNKRVSICRGKTYSRLPSSIKRYTA